MRPKFQKQSALKLVGRIIPEAKRSGISAPSFRNKVHNLNNLRVTPGHLRLRLVDRMNETQILQTQCRNICKLNSFRKADGKTIPVVTMGVYEEGFCMSMKS